MAKKIEMLCGCHVDRGVIVFCRWHGKVQEMAAELNFIRGYFLQPNCGGEESPFVKRIDKLIPRQ